MQDPDFQKLTLGVREDIMNVSIAESGISDDQDQSCLTLQTMDESSFVGDATLIQSQSQEGGLSTEEEVASPMSQSTPSSGAMSPAPVESDDDDDDANWEDAAESAEGHASPPTEVYIQFMCMHVLYRDNHA